MDEIVKITYDNNPLDAPAYSGVNVRSLHISELLIPSFGKDDDRLELRALVVMHPVDMHWRPIHQ
jgi:hypothetical protein